MTLIKTLLAAAVILGAGLGAASPAALAAPVRIVALGDSLTAGFQLPPGEGFAPQLEKALKAKGFDVAVIDAGVSGDTSTGGLARLDWSVPPDADAVIVELGANDMLRGADPKVPEAALDAILKRLSERGLPVLLAGMRAPPNLGPDYGRAFDAIYPDLAKKYDAVLYPFFLDGVAAQASLQLPDGMHPNAAGVARIVEGILPSVEALIGRIKR